jgi:hypothetical protein
MSALGQKQTSDGRSLMSALPPQKADTKAEMSRSAQTGDGAAVIPQSAGNCTDPPGDFRKLTTDARQMAEENVKLRKINSQMISALEYVLPLLQQGLPATVDFDWTKEAVAKVQDALAEAERD